MMNNSLEKAHRRKGIFLLVLPVILLPVLVLILSGSTPAKEETEKTGNGMNLEMPKPILAKKQESKSEAYVAEKINREEEPWGLPDFLINPSELAPVEESKSLDFIPVSIQTEESAGWGTRSIYQKSPTHQASISGLDPEEQMLRQLQELELVLNQEAKEKKQGPAEAVSLGSMNQDPELLQLQQLMAKMESKSSTPDPEIEQLEHLIDKLLLLQNPDLVNSQVKEEETINPIQLAQEKEEEQDGFLEDETNGFFGLEQDQSPGISNRRTFRKTISAKVAKTQEIYPGEAIEIQLEEELNLVSGLIPAGTILFAQTSISGSRLQVTVSGILQENRLIPVALKGYGLDGIPGIEFSAVTGSAQWVSHTGKSAEGIRINSMGMDWQSQLATSGVEATRSLLRSKTKRKKLEIKSGHPFLLIDTSTTNSPKL